MIYSNVLRILNQSAVATSFTIWSSCHTHTRLSYLHTALGEAKPLLDHSGQFSDATALLP